MLSRAIRPRARAASLAISRISRTVATKPSGGNSPFAPPPEPEAGTGKLTRYEELKQRQDDMAKMMRDKTMLEVNNAAKVRPQITPGPFVRLAPRAVQNAHPPPRCRGRDAGPMEFITCSARRVPRVESVVSRNLRTSPARRRTHVQPRTSPQRGACKRRSQRIRPWAAVCTVPPPRPAMGPLAARQLVRSPAAAIAPPRRLSAAPGLDLQTCGPAATLLPPLNLAG